jgi:putative Mg2+ transporter-C (MgtC) family protein
MLNVGVPEFDLIVRLLLAALVGYVISLERKLSGHPAGDRTFALTCLGAAIFALISLKGFAAGDSRIAAGVVSGLGFLGAGMIIRTHGSEIKGLTTAAGIWSVGAVGLALGSGMYILGIASAVLVLFLLASERVLHIDERLAVRRKDLRRQREGDSEPHDDPSA